jgi:hypothetical protein
MSNRWFSLAVVLFWLAAMGWLVSEKVVPALQVGERPTPAIADVQPARLPVAWELQLNEKPLGWASTDAIERPDQVVELRNRVHLDRFPLKEIAPWVAQLLDPDGRDGQMPFDTDSRIEMRDSHLLGFRTSISFGELQDAILVNGTVEADQLLLHLRAGNFTYNTKTALATDAIMGDSLSPRARLSNLRIGQTWTEPVYNPLSPPNNPLQILQATVERYDPIAWNGQVVSAALVVYRDDPGAEGRASRAPRAQAWVARDGNVLRQEVMLLGVRLLFLRLPPGQLAEGAAAP